MDAPHLRLCNSKLAIRNVFTRLPFRFGAVTMEASAVAILEVEVEFNDGKRAAGVSSDMLAYKWFDKNPKKSPADNVAELLQALRAARQIYQELPAATPFDLWLAADTEIERAVLDAGGNRLIAAFANSMLERALIDALGRHIGLSFDQMVRSNALGIRPEAVFPTLGFDDILASLPNRPSNQVALRHTVGMIDPLTDAELGVDAPMDGLPVSLERYIAVDQLNYLKIKVGGDRDHDLERLTRTAAVIAASGRDIKITLDGNEQFGHIDDFVALAEQIQSRPALASLWSSILFIEQPLHRDTAMTTPLPAGAKAAIGRPLLIDEADGWITAFNEAIDLGYEGVSHKNCKGVFHSLLNAGLASVHNKTLGQKRYFQSAEDLTNLAVVPLQADLAVVATLGISHVERNGHHYFAGLDHLPQTERAAALARHDDLYETAEDGGRLRISNGILNIASLQVPGLGVVDNPDLNNAIAEQDWQFSMLETQT
ncbi:mandelate racemase [Devosia algicola]|uniref:Mandelate racemase n=1 Tax=Devosia algicola TaxID=3026418 RepID=A0ABY7YNQ1_9HYPH|nr:mandelate racemase [Devosia algicola]WDR02896.1 mandelate racemase [Devosia algicola]